MRLEEQTNNKIRTQVMQVLIPLVWGRKHPGER